MLRYLAKQVVARVSAVDAMVAIAIETLREVLVGLNQRLGVIECVHGVNIIVGRSVTDQQVAMQLLHTLD